MTTPSTVGCPKCGVAVTAEGASQSSVILCPQCRTLFPLQAGCFELRTSRKAIASLVLGLASILGTCLTGIPAVMLGVLALLDINRLPGQLKGRGMAVTGILSGGVCGLLCTPIAAIVAYTITTVGKQFSDQPVDATAVAQQIGTYDVPAGLTPIASMDALGFRMVHYRDDEDDPNVQLMLMQYPQWMAGQTEQMETRARQEMEKSGYRPEIQVLETRQVTYTVRGEPVEVTEWLGTDESGERGREYIGFLPGEAGPVMVLIITGNPPPGDTAGTAAENKKLTLSDDDVRKFFESFR